MSGRRRRSESLWDRKEAENETKEFDSGGDSPKRSNSEINEVLMSDDFSMQGNESMLIDNDNIGDKHGMKMDPAFDEWEGQYGQSYRGDGRVAGGKDRARSRSRSWSPHRDRTRGRDRGRTHGLARSRSRSRSRGREQDRAMSPSRDGGSNRLDNDSAKKWSNNRPEYSGGSQYQRTHKSGYNNDQDHRRQSNQNIKPCKFFIMGRCNRDNCRFSHDVPKSDVYEGRSQDHNDYPNPNPNFPDNNYSDSGNINLNGNGHNRQLNRSVKEEGKPLEASRNDIPQASSLPQISQDLNFANALGLLYSTVVNEPVKAGASMENQKSTEPVGNMEVNVNKKAEKSNTNVGKTEVEGKVDEGNMGNDEKAMRGFKIALVEFVKEILKPTWKEGKMSREVYKTIVKKVVEKVTSTMQGVQIPRTQEKTDQYLTFSKSKITKLVEAYVGRHVKA
ncbi:putative transcription factor C3H family [Helianthus annuus]|nr:putative transcription factor C3H family [Helianthus annuus]